MLPHIPCTKSRDAIYPGDVENVHQEVQVGMLRDVPQHTLGCKDVFVVNMFVHDVPRPDMRATTRVPASHPHPPPPLLRLRNLSTYGYYTWFVCCIRPSNPRQL